jgi:molybdate transport system substrate-binding protein
MYRALALLLAIAAATPQTPPSVTVSAAISLTDALTAAAEQYKSAGGGPVLFNFGGSNVLARQIVNGAPVDLFISADEAQMDLVARAGLVADGTRVNLLTNLLAVVVPGDRPRTLSGIRDLLDPAFKRIAIGDPDAVPAGVYARAFLQQEGLWDALRPRIIASTNVRAALTAVETGAADAGIVYRTDARMSTHAAVAWTVPAERGPRIVYPAAIVKGAANAGEAARFLAFLRGAQADRIFARFGFARPPAGR